MEYKNEDYLIDFTKESVAFAADIGYYRRKHTQYFHRVSSRSIQSMDVGAQSYALPSATL
jgi:hypothetical protein